MLGKAFSEYQFGFYEIFDRENDGTKNCGEDMRFAKMKFTPALQPVVIIYPGGGGYESGRPAAFVYPLPDGKLIRLPFNDDNTYAYDKATVFPANHPAVLAAKASSSYREGEIIRIKISEEGQPGDPANEADVSLIRGILETQRKRFRQELETQKLMP